MSEEIPGSTGETDAATVVVVDDESGLTEVYAHSLAGEFDVRTANGGEEALEVVDEDVDVVFLDRRMPDLSGDEVLERLADRGFDLRAVMVTAVEPDFDVLEMPFDGYLVKPVTGEDLRETAKRILERAEYADAVQRYYTLAEKQAVLQDRKSADELAENEGYQTLLDEMKRARERADGQLTSLSADDYEEAFRDL